MMRIWITARRDGGETTATVHAAAPYGRRVPREANVTVEVTDPDLIADLRDVLESVEEAYADEVEAAGERSAAQSLVAAMAAGEE